MSWTQSRTRRAPLEWVALAIDKWPRWLCPGVFPCPCAIGARVQDIDQLVRHNAAALRDDLAGGSVRTACQSFKRNDLLPKVQSLSTRLALFGAVARQDVDIP